MAVEIEGLEFQIQSDSDKAAKGVDALADSFEKLKKSLKGNAGLNGVSKKLEAINSAKDKLTGMEKLESLAKALNQLNTVKISPTISKRLTDIGSAINTITPAAVQNVSNLATALQRIQGLQVPNLRGLTGGRRASSANSAPASAPAGASAAGAATSGMTQYTAQTQQATVQTNSFLSALGRVARGVDGLVGISYPFTQLKSALTGVPQKISEVVGKLREMYGQFKNSGGVIGMFSRSIKSLASSLGSKLAASMKNFTSSLGKGFTSPLKKATSGLGKLGYAFKQVLLYQGLSSLIYGFANAMKEGINNLYQYSSLMGGQFKSSMDSLATSFQYLKNSMGAMVSPIINALAPAIDFLIDKFVALLNIVNQFFARLTGASTYTAAKKSAASYGDTINDTAGTAKKAAKEIKDATTGIDELNIISQNDNSGSGGGGAGGKDYGSMFEQLPIENSISEFADKLKAAFEAGDWKELGTLLGEKFNEIVDGIDWSGIGHKIGYGLNGAIQTAYWFLDTVDFTNLGAHIAELLNAALSEIDFTYAGRLLVKTFTILPDMIIGGLSELDWGLVGKSISDFIIGAFDEATKWLNSYNWSDLGSLLWQKIKDLFTNIDWGGIASSIFTFLGTAIRSCVEFLGGFFGSIGKDIKNWWDKEIAGEDWKETAVNLLNAIGKGFADIGSWVMDNMIDPLFNALVGEEKWAEFKQAGRDLWNGFTQGVQEFFDDPGAWIKQHIVDPFVKWFKDLFGIHSPSTVMKEIGQYVVEGFLEGINFFSSIAGTVKKWGSSVVEWFTKGEDGKGIVEHFKDIAGNIISGFKDKVGSTYTTVKTNVTTWASKVKEWFTSNSFGGVNLSTFATYANETIEGFKSKIGSAYTNVKTNITTWASKVKEWFTSSSYGGVNYQNFSTFANNTIEGFKSKIGSAYTTVKTNVTTWASKVKEWFTSSSFGGVNSANFSTFASNVITGFKDKIGSAYTTTKSNIQTWATNVKNWFTGIASNSAFAGFASDVINGFKNKIGSYYTTAKSNITTWASKVKEWFQSENSNDSWSTIAKNIVDGFANGVTSWARRCKDAVVSWGQSVLNWFEDTLDINSPSKVFYKIGGFAVAGFNNAIAQVGKTTRSVVGEWANSFTNITPTMAMAVDTSALRYYDSDAFARTISSNVETNNEISSTGFKQAMEDFYREYVEPTLNQIAEDTRRQADKDEHPIVQIGNRVITDAVDVQTKANGYRFTK